MNGVVPVNSQPRSLSVHVGEILYGIPAINMYLIAPAHSLSYPKPSSILATTITGQNRTSLSYSDPYSPGDRVLYVRYDASFKLTVGPIEEIAVIIGPFCDLAIGFPEDQPSTSLFNSTDYFNSALTSTVSAFSTLPNTEAPGAVLIQDRSYGQPLDILTNDFSRVSSLGPFILIGNTYSGIGASHTARLEFNPINNKTILTAENFQQLSAIVSKGNNLDLGDCRIFEKVAYNLREGLGAYGKNSPFKKEEDVIKKQEELQKPIYRKECFEGKLVEGSLKTWLIPRGNQINTYGSDDIPFGVSSERTFYNGKMEYRSAKEISFVKSIFIPVPVEIKVEDENVPKDEVFESWADEKGIKTEDYTKYSAILSPEEFDTDTQGVNQARLVSRPDYWKIPPKEDVVGEQDNLAAVLKPLEEDKTEYDAPPTIEIEDKTREKKELYHTLESFIKQMSDGAIVISDGHGSEIRMHRGKITISAATNVEIVSGKDTVVMSGRHGVFNAQKDVQVQSSLSDVYLKADNNMTLLSGNSGEGVMLVENRSENRLQSSTWKEGLTNGIPIADGVLIKSNKSLGIVSEDTYIGISDDADKNSSGGLSRSKSGSITLDSAKGDLVLLGENSYMLFAGQCLIGADESCTHYSASGYKNIANVMQMSTNDLQVTGLDSVQLLKLGVDGVETYSTTGAGEAKLRVDGLIQSSKDIQSLGTVRANLVVAEAGNFGNGSNLGTSGSGPDFDPPETDVDAVNDLTGVISSRLRSTEGLLTGQGLFGTKFSYKSSDNLNTKNYKTHLSRWQYMMKTESPSTWSEPVVLDSNGSDSLVYPGHAAWNIKNLFDGSEAGAILRERFIVNTKETR